MDRPNQEAELPDFVEPLISAHRSRSRTLRRAAKVAWYVAGGVIGLLLFVRGGSLAAALIQGVAVFLGIGLLGRILLDKSHEMRAWSVARKIDERVPRDDPARKAVVEFAKRAHDDGQGLAALLGYLGIHLPRRGRARTITRTETRVLKGGEWVTTQSETAGDAGNFSVDAVIEKAQARRQRETDKPTSTEIVEAIPLSVDRASERDEHLPLEPEPYRPDDTSTSR